MVGYGTIQNPEFNVQNETLPASNSPHFGYLRKAEQVERDSGARSAPLSRLKLVPLILNWAV